MKSSPLNEEIELLENGHTDNNNKDNFQKHKSFYSFLENIKIKYKPLISVILPLFNEEKTIKKVLENLPHHSLIEVIVIDDSSEDNSLEEIRKAKSPRKIKIIKHSKNKGYGGAILSGIKNSLGKIIVTMDTDGQHSSDDIFNLIKPILEEDVDLTIGSRYLGKYFYKLPIVTRLGEIIIEKVIQIFFGIKIMNNQNGFRAFNSQINHIFENMTYRGYAFCTETILKANLNGYKIKECPIKVYDREYGYSKIVVRQLAIRIFMCIFQYLGIKYLPSQKDNENTFLKKLFKKLLKYF
ncbi:MAG: glycosyltransferase family 2 protein [Promethearchaeota archaeon]|nr:MAG: glycosyltransferase family 2 protein [Candidatus Lokiarchaeota archaeon]